MMDEKEVRVSMLELPVEHEVMRFNQQLICFFPDPSRKVLRK